MKNIIGLFVLLFCFSAHSVEFVDEGHGLTSLICNCSKSSLQTRIWFVNNSNLRPGDGSFENPFSTLKAAEAASKPGDSIYVFPGNGTSSGMNLGFVMKDRQRLLGSGIPHDFVGPSCCLTVAAQTKDYPKIESINSDIPAVQLGNGCEVSGIHIIGTNNADGILGGIDDGIFTSPGITDACIHDNIIENCKTKIGGIFFNNCDGNVSIRNNTIQNIDGLGGVVVSDSSNTKLNLAFSIVNNSISLVSSVGLFLEQDGSGSWTSLVKGNNIQNNPGGSMFIKGDGNGTWCCQLNDNTTANNGPVDLLATSTNVAKMNLNMFNNKFLTSTVIGIVSDLNGVMCLRLQNNKGAGAVFELFQLGTSLFQAEPIVGNEGLLLTFGLITSVPAGTCNCIAPSDGCPCNK